MWLLLLPKTIVFGEMRGHIFFCSCHRLINITADFYILQFVTLICLVHTSTLPQTTESGGRISKTRSTDFEVLERAALIGNAHPLSTRVAKSLLRCAGYCAKDSRCFSFVFAPGDGQCQLHSLNATDIKMAHSEDSSVYVLVQGLDASFGVHSSARNLMHSMLAGSLLVGMIPPQVVISSIPTCSRCSRFRIRSQPNRKETHHFSIAHGRSSHFSTVEDVYCTRNAEAQIQHLFF